MLSKIFIFLAVFATLLLAKVQNVELMADDVTKNGDIIEASGNVILYSQDYFITADKAIYDEKKQIAEFFGNVNSMRNLNETSRANYVKIDLKNNTQEANANFMMDKDAELWMQNDKSCADKDYYRTKGSIVSSCNVADPDWHINFTSGKLNKESKFLHLFNPVFYVGDVPILYLPYFGFPTDTTRRTGLLIPEMGYMSDEGFYYKQPVYFAPYDSWDFELDPQIRSRRGVGIYGIFRFADSPYSNGEIRSGIFENKERHQKRLELKDKKHYGFEVEYDRSKLIGYLKQGDFKENLWINFTQLNDLEYFDLSQKNGYDDSENSLVTSRLNYYLTNDDHYFGTYARYYIDTSKLNRGNIFQNDDTVQEIPTFQYHKFADNIILPNLIYSVDTKFHNYIRKEGVNANQYELNVPISFSKQLLGDYLNFSFTEDLYATHIDWSDNYRYFGGEFFEDKSSDYVNNYHLFSLSTDLAKAYGSLYHTMNFGTDLLIAGYKSSDLNDRILKDYRYKYDKKNGNLNIARLENLQDNLYYEDNFINELSDEYTNSNLAGKFTQYFYDGNGKKFLRHAVKQRYNLEDDEFGPLDHRVDLYLGNFNIGNRFTYSQKFHSFDKVQTYANYNNSAFSAYMSHTYEYEKLNDDASRYNKDNYLIFNAALKLPKYYEIFGVYEYDLLRDYSKMWRLGLTHNRKCWNYSIVYQEDIEPKTSSLRNYEKASKERVVYFFVNFYPFGGVGYDYSKDTDYTEGK